MGNQLLIIVVVLLGMWMGVVTVFLFRMIGHYNKLTKGITNRGLKEILEQVLQNQKGLSEYTKQLEQELNGLTVDGRLHIQRIGIVRFNPFSDTGGSQSFTLAFLDGNENGLVMTSLYARTGNRWYVKEIRTGKGKELELSKEEQAAIKRARLLTDKHL
ncbi:hypothetical protein A2Z00_05170 [Candidatus Gottesmanbacteria bacterium RBG_13_45_10]|uniref:DUF4446 domain-containing protein n=1 Tax=Candidatus Gottesmanbacteria bacterium RBG_13_45_10 TaxID=1798370 RepID=A0A1F5ZGN2_9BACT|nr:MAG: hypothetical protein A2Z00_05170 [Candidatus Gottesmanbacteria bacterium RBG_13_45_10]